MSAVGNRTVRPESVFFLLFLFLAFPATAVAEEPAEAGARVVEPFLEIHTGPASEYPVFYVAEKGESIVLIKRRTDWYKVRLNNGKEGWARRTEIEKTLLSVGREKGFLDRMFDRYVAGRLEMGWAAGSLGGDPLIRVRTAYRFGPTVGFEANAGFSSGGGEKTSGYLGGLWLTVWSGRFASLEATMGAGVVRVSPDPLILEARAETFPEVHAGFGIRFPVYKTLAVRGDFRNFTFFSNTVTTREFQEYSAGLSYGF